MAGKTSPEMAGDFYARFPKWCAKAKIVCMYSAGWEGNSTKNTNYFITYLIIYISNNLFLRFSILTRILLD